MQNAAIQQNRSEPDTREPALRALQAGVDAAGMMRFLEGIAGHVKLAGTPSERESLAKVEAAMRAVGYRTEVLAHDAFISLPGAARLQVDGLSYPAITHSMARATAAEGVSGGLVDLRDGGEAAFASADLRGRIVLVDGIASPAVARRASRAGVGAVIHVSPHEHLHEMCISTVWGNPSTGTIADLPACPVITVSDAHGAELRERLREAGSLQATVHAEVDTGWRKTPILVADLPSMRGEADEPFVLFSGHHDTWHHGVMDNGSANAAMVEVARLCASRREAWKRGLRICFWSGHSQGRYSGSAWYADEHFAELDRRCVAHVNIDSPGGVGADILANTGVVTELRPLASAAIRAETGETLAGKRKARSADDSFPGLGIPSMFGSLSGRAVTGLKMRNALGWWWHTPEDLIDKIDPAHLARDTRVLLEAVWRLVSEDRLPIDQAAKVDELVAELGPLVDALADDTCAKPLLEAARKLAATIRHLDDGVSAGPRNEAVVRVSRALMPLDYTRGDRFVHDDALPLPAWPVLEPIRRLAALDAADPGRLPARVDAVRARNRILHHLSLAQAAVDRALAPRP
ncbi:M28 family peptidase [Aureimonas flava]|nr:M28 family peptidase [Aureimonas flava]